MTIKTLIFFFLIALFSSCSTTKFKRRNLENSAFDLLKDGLTKVCLSGEGKGRFYVEGEKQTFSFESLLSYDRERLDISYHFPFHGEEGLSIFYKDAMKGQVTYKGSLFDRLERGQKGRAMDLKNFFSPYFGKLGQFLILLRSFKQKDLAGLVRCYEASRERSLIKGRCTYGPLSKVFLWETSTNHFSFLFDLPSQDGFLRLVFNREKEKIFSKWIIAFIAHGQNGMPLKIEKYITSCEE